MPMLQSILEIQGITTQLLFTSEQEPQPLGEGFSSLLLGYQQNRLNPMQIDIERFHTTQQEGEAYQQERGGNLTALLADLIASLQKMMEIPHPEDEPEKTPLAEPLDFNDQEAPTSAVKQLSELLTYVEAILSQLDLQVSDQPAAPTLATAQTRGSALDAANFVSQNLPGREQNVLTENEQKAFPGLGKRLEQVLMQLQSLTQAGHETQDVLLPSEYAKASSQQLLKSLPQARADFDRQNQSLLTTEKSQSLLTTEKSQSLLTTEKSQSLLTTEHKLTDKTETGLRLASERAFSKESMAQLREKLQKIKHLVKQMMAHQSQGAVLGQKELATQMKVMQQTSHALNAMTETIVSVADAGTSSAIMSVFQPLNALWGTAKNNLDKAGLKTNGHYQFQKVSSQPLAEAEKFLADDAGEQASSQSSQDSPATQTRSVKGGLMQPGVTQTTLALPVRHPQWGEQLAQRVLFLAQNSQQLAQIRLHPAHLGPIQVKMKLEQDQSVQVSLHAHHALTREAIEQAVPRLRELFAQQGLALGDIQVQADAQGHAQAFAQMRREQQQSQIQGGGADHSVVSEKTQDAEAPTLRSLQVGLVDHFV